MSYPNSDAILYITGFGKSLITPYRLVQSMFAVLYLNGCAEFSCDLQEWFYKQKVKEEYKEIMLPMYFKNNGVFYYSRELEEVLSMLYMVGLLRKGGSPSNIGTYFLEYNNAIAKQILEDIEDKKVLKLIYTMGKQFKEDILGKDKVANE